MAWAARPLGQVGAVRMYLSEPKRSVVVGVSPLFFLASSAQVALAPSICFMLAMQVFFWLAARALTKLGMAMAASKPMMATTIIISTSVKPAFRVRLTFISNLSFDGVNESKRLVNIMTALRSLTAFYKPHGEFSTANAKRGNSLL